MESVVTKEVAAALKKIPRTIPDTICAELFRAKRVFVWGIGRSGMIGKMFAIRLRHLGIESWFVDEPICPPFAKNDLLFVFSKTGKKKMLMQPVAVAKREKMRIVGISSPDTPLLKRVHVPLPVPLSSSKQFGGSLFEQCLFLTLETCVERYRSMRRISFNAMERNHANWE